MGVEKRAEMWYNKKKVKGVRMLNKSKENRNQIQFFCIDDLVPIDHLLRQIDRAIDWSFIYELVAD